MEANIMTNTSKKMTIIDKELLESEKYKLKIIENSRKLEFEGLVILSKENVAKVEAMIRIDSRYRSDIQDKPEKRYIEFIKNKNEYKAPNSNNGSDLYWINLLTNY